MESFPSRVRIPIFLLGVALVLVAYSACDDDGTGPAPAAEVELTPASVSFGALDDTEQLQATVLDDQGNEVTDASVEWSSSDPAVASVDNAGLVTAVGEGSATITATSGNASGEASVTVEQVIVEARVTPDDPAMQVDQTMDFDVTALDGNGNEVTGGLDVTWSVMDPSIAAVDTDGVVMSESVGTTSVQAEIASRDGEPVGVHGDVSLTVAEVVRLEIVDNAFRDLQDEENENASVTVPLGTTVRWEYLESGATQHTVTSGEGQSGDAGDGVPDGATNELASGLMNPGDTFEFTFETAGTWTYFCQVHPTIMFNSTVTVRQ